MSIMLEPHTTSRESAERGGGWEAGAEPASHLRERCILSFWVVNDVHRGRWHRRRSNTKRTGTKGEESTRRRIDHEGGPEQQAQRMQVPQASASLAQLDRAGVCEPQGREFEPPRERIYCGPSYIKSVCALPGISQRIWLDLRLDPFNCAELQAARAEWRSG